MKITYQRKLTFSFLIIFTLFTVGIVIFEQRQARQYKTEALEERLDAYADLIYSMENGKWRIKNEEFEKPESATASSSTLHSPFSILPPELRITLISPDGTVAYDNLFTDVSALENHADRPEVSGARQTGQGSFIRTSASTNRPYLYYAKYYGNGYVRVALPYDIQVQSFLKPGNGFLYFIVALFITGFLFIYLVGSRFGKSIRELRDFSLAVNLGKERIETPHFPKDELGEIGAQIVRDYSKVKDSEQQLKQEREKLLQHVQSSAEGICFFNPDHSVAFYNGLFLQYLNTLSRNTVSSSNHLLGEEVFKPVLVFLRQMEGDNYFETHTSRNGKEFLIRVNVFDDGSFEIILNDVTAREKTRQLKQEMTGNIAHELRTPVTSIRGFLETVLENDLDKNKERHYLERAYGQTKTLSELISDMSLLTKIEQGTGSFPKKEIGIAALLSKVEADLKEALMQKNISFESSVADDLVVEGNENLLYSIFRNLTDNVIRHAGENIAIRIRTYDGKDGRAYFSFADNGVGIKDEMQLNRLFERFYRINEGRTRDSGGSGLGLAIVKNAVSLHGGNIIVKRGETGLEFLFDLEKIPPGDSSK